MEFITDQEVLPVLREVGITTHKADDGRVTLRLRDDPDVVRYYIRSSTGPTPDENPAEVLTVDAAALGPLLVRVLHRFHLDQAILIPVGRWGNVLDAVAYSMARDDGWIEFDQTATVERNTRDPVLCLPKDFQTLDELIKALIADADQPDQGLVIATPASPVILELIPGGAARLSIGSAPLADLAAAALRP